MKSYQRFLLAAVASAGLALTSFAQNLTISADANPIAVGGTTVLSATSDVHGPQIKIEVASDGVNFVSLNGAGVVYNGVDVTAVFAPQVAGTYTVRAHSAASPPSLKQAKSAELTIIVTETQCEADVTIAATFAGGNGTPTKGESGSWTYSITVHTCVDLAAGSKVQGGNVAWLSLVSVTPSTGTSEINTKNKNSTITWILPAMEANTSATLTVTQNGTAKTLGVQPISGPWSIVYRTADADPADPSTKSSYTPRVTIDVQP